MTSISIRGVSDDRSINAAKALIREHFEAHSEAHEPSQIDAIIGKLPDPYVPPMGGLWVAWKGAEAVGCVALQAQSADAGLQHRSAGQIVHSRIRERSHFLPGGWEALKSPHPPMESWKLALYGMRNAEGDPVPPLGRFLALAPFHAMFEAAWERVTSGDVPRYDEVK